VKPQVVIVTDRLTRLYWLTWGVAALLAGTFLGLLTVYAYVYSWVARWLP
jgi:hypothetical protein